MATNPPLGNEFWQGPLGVVNTEFDGSDLGKTTAETTVEFIEDITDIIFQQDGTQPADKIPTGQAWQVTVNYGEISTTLIAALLRGVTVSGTGKSTKLDRSLYISGLDTFAKELILKRVDSTGTSSADPFYWLTFYKAFPIVSGGTINYGADTQKNLEITYYCFYDSVNAAFGYSGYASSVGL